MPARARHQVRLEAVTDGNTITIVERRAPWRPEYGPEWSSRGMVRFRYEPRFGAWSLFWSDRHRRWHERDPTSIFWG